MNRFRPAIAVGFALLCGACGYRVSGHADALPKNIKTIAIPAFGNATTLYRLTDRLPADIAREFISRTRYAVVTDPNKADAVMSGSVIKVYSGAATLDPTVGRATSAQMTVTLFISLTDRATGKVIYSRNFEARERYEVSTDTRAYFEETDSALDRLSREVARDTVSAILEKF